MTWDVGLTVTDILAQGRLAEQSKRPSVNSLISVCN